MESILPGDAGAGPHRGRLNRAVKESLRDLGAQLSLLNHSVGTRLDLRPPTWSALTSSPGTARSARAPWPVAPGCTPPP